MQTSIKKVTILKPRGFTLIEMIGVLAVIAILAAMLIPKIFEAVNNSRINNVAVTCATIKTAIADHYAKFGAIPVDGTQTPPAILPIPLTAYDRYLIKEGFLDKPFAVKIGDGTTNASVVLSTCNNVSTVVPVPSGNTVGGVVTDAEFNLTGIAGTANEVLGQIVAYAVIPGVLPADALALSLRIDGSSLSEAVIGTPDQRGRVKYTAPDQSGLMTVYVYLAHR
jgi:prepilin-type N-terminal cleavage/methylation domain-containing protein